MNTEWKAGLPADTSEFTIPDPSDHASVGALIKHELYRKTDNPNASPYLIFHNIDPELIEHIYSGPHDYDLPRICIFYNDTTHELIAKKPGDRVQSAALRRFTNVFQAKPRELRLEKELILERKKTWEFYKARKSVFMKAADDSYGPYDEHCVIRFLPPLVIERGYMEFLPILRGEAVWWLIAGRGEVQAVIVIGINRTKPELVVEEEWRVCTEDKDGVSGAVKTQEVNMKLDQDGLCQVTGAPFTVRFHDLFLRGPTNEQEEDFVYTMEDLKRYATSVWGEQGFIEYLV